MLDERRDARRRRDRPRHRVVPQRRCGRATRPAPASTRDLLAQFPLARGGARRARRRRLADGRVRGRRRAGRGGGRGRCASRASSRWSSARRTRTSRSACAATRVVQLDRRTRELCDEAGVSREVRRAAGVDSRLAGAGRRQRRRLSRACRAGARSRPRRCSRATGTSRRIPETRRAWDVPVRGAGAAGRDAAPRERDRALLFRTLATLRDRRAHRRRRRRRFAGGDRARTSRPGRRGWDRRRSRSARPGSRQGSIGHGPDAPGYALPRGDALAPRLRRRDGLAALRARRLRHPELRAAQRHAPRHRHAKSTRTTSPPARRSSRPTPSAPTASASSGTGSVGEVRALQPGRRAHRARGRRRATPTWRARWARRASSPACRDRGRAASRPSRPSPSRRRRSSRAAPTCSMLETFRHLEELEHRDRGRRARRARTRRSSRR